jgi:hypothetical protein
MSNENGIIFDNCKKNIIPSTTPNTPKTVFSGCGLACGAPCVLNILLPLIGCYLNFSNKWV